MKSKRVVMLPCPICGERNPVSRENARLKCSKCGTMLRSVRVNIKKSQRVT